MPARSPSPRFADQDFLLNSTTARTLYHDVAAGLPIIDYHSHLSPADIAARKSFRNITELWLGGDHYKWRLMRAGGVPEALITGAAGDEEKFRAFCKLLPAAIGNPVHHWSHLELQRLFGISLTINEANAGAIWEQANARLADMNAWTFLEQAGVEVACTTDDPADDLAEHAAIAESDLKTRVLPAFRPDRAMRINRKDFPAYLDILGRSVGTRIDSFAALIAALESRIGYFHERGARISDHAVDTVLPAIVPAAAQLESLFARRLAGAQLSESEKGQYESGVLAAVGTFYARRGWAMCLHIGAQRDNSTRLRAKLGADAGGDSISDISIGTGLAALLDSLDAQDQLPRTVLFCLNPAHNPVLSTMAGNFQEGGTPGKIQFGPAWWFNDHKEGMLQQLSCLASHGVLGGFIGMVSDSRSFATYPRHDYFRRLLCRQLGDWVEGGEYPADFEALSQLVRGICCDNARRYFRL